MQSLFGELRQFVDNVSIDQHRPQQKWLRDVAVGALGGKSLMLSEIGRYLRETARTGGPRRLIHTEKRLSRNLLSDRLDEGALSRRLLSRAEQFTRAADGEGVVVAVDYTDIDKRYSRPYAERGQEYAAPVWDGSEGTTHVGYGVVQIHASLPDGNGLPLCLRASSPAQEDFKSQTHEFCVDVERVAPHVGPKAIWVLDRGFDASRYFELCERVGVRWGIRLVITGSRCRRMYVVGKHANESCRDIGLRAKERYAFEVSTGKGRRRAKVTLRVGVTHVHPPRSNGDVDPSRTFSLVTVWGFGEDPLVLLVGEEVRGRAAALSFAKAYTRRWTAEEATRAAKDRFGWGLDIENIRSLKLAGVRRLLLLTQMLYAWLAELRVWLKGADVRTRRHLSALVRRFDHTAPASDDTYALFRMVAAYVLALPLRLFRRWRGS